MSILDLDMVNMGNKARKALRELKLRMQVAQPGVALKAIDRQHTEDGEAKWVRKISIGVWSTSQSLALYPIRDLDL